MASVSGIDLNLLVALDALLEERNLTRAGAKLNLSQPTMSGALARLRRHFSDELLVRSGRHYTLTPVAERLLPAVQQAVRQVEQTFTISGGFDPAVSTRRFSIAISGQSIVSLSDMLRRVHELAPGVRLDLSPVAPGLLDGDRELLRHDLLIAPMGARPAGQPEVIFRDRFVCVVDPANPRLRDGQLTIADLRDMTHAVATLPHAEVDPVGSALRQLGITPAVGLITAGWLALPFSIAGTDMVAAVPEKLARRVSKAARIAITELPIGTIELVEAVWWHSMREADPALTWLRGILRETADCLTRLSPGATAPCLIPRCQARRRGSRTWSWRRRYAGSPA